MRLTIVGLGTLGASLGLALKAATPEASDPAAERIVITGHDPDTALVGRAKKLGAVDRTHWNLIAACEGAELILLALPLGEVEQTLGALSAHLQPGTVLLELAPLKAPVLAAAESALPEGVDLIGGHVVSPLLGLGLLEPSADLFEGAAMMLVAPERAAPRAVEMATNLALAVGATPHFVEAPEHDGLVAATEGLPLAAALALARALDAQEGRADRREFAGAPLLAATAPLLAEGARSSALAAALLANAEQLLPWLSAYREQLARLAALLEARDAQGLEEAAHGAQRVAQTLRGAEADAAPDSTEGRGFLRGLLLGGLGRPRKPRG